MIQAIVLGLVQGLTEFVPVSSSAHLFAIPKMFGWPDMGLSFDVALHWGTLVALVIYFRRDWGAILSSRARRRGQNEQVGARLLGWIIVACIPAAIVGKALDKRVDALRAWPPLIIVIACVLVLVGLVMLLAERIGKKKRGMDKMNWLDYTIIGCAQALALFPGVSRSGITISAGLFRGLDRESAARFSFLLSTPVIFGAGLLKIKDMLDASRHGQHVPAMPMLVGFVCAAVSGYLAIHLLMNYLRSRSMGVFVVYRVCFAAVLAGFFLLRG